MISRQISPEKRIHKIAPKCVGVRECINPDTPCILTHTHTRNSKLSCITPYQTILRYVQFTAYSIPWTEPWNDTTWSAGGFMGTSNEFNPLFFSPLSTPGVAQKNFVALNMKIMSLSAKSAFSPEI